MEKEKILIIDDDQHIRMTLSGILKIKGYETFTATKGSDGLEKIKEYQMNMVIIDLNLPDMSGLDVLSRMKELNPLLEAVILTGNASIDSAIDATNKGAFSYLLKPYDMDQVLLHIRRAIEKQRAQETIAKDHRELEKMNAQLIEINRELEKEVLERRKAEDEKEKLIVELKESLAKIKTLNGLLPICSWCKKIRNDAGYWQQLESYIGQHSGAEFSHGICPDCLREKYPEYYMNEDQDP